MVMGLLQDVPAGNCLICAADYLPIVAASDVQRVAGLKTTDTFFDSPKWTGLASRIGIVP